MSFSYSRIKTFEECRQAFFLLYKTKDKVLQVQNMPGQTGSDCHDILEAYIRHLQDIGAQEDLPFADFLVDTMSNSVNHADVKNVLKFYSETHLWDGSGVDEVHMELPLGIKEDLTPTAFDSPDAWYRGKLDRVEIRGDEATITDYKTSRLLPTQDEWLYDKQKRSYLMLLALNRPELKKIHMVFDYVRWNVKFTDTHDIVPGMSEEIAAIIAASISEIEKATEFPPTPSPFCALCSAFHACPVTKGEYDTVEPIIDTIKDPESSAKKIVILERLVSDMKAGLKAVVDKDGPIAYGKDQWEYRLTEGAEVIDTKEFLDYLFKKNGADRATVLGAISLSKTAVKKIQKETGILILNEDGTTAEEFETMVLPRFTSKFGRYKKR